MWFGALVLDGFPLFRAYELCVVPVNLWFVVEDTLRLTRQHTKMRSMRKILHGNGIEWYAFQIILMKCSHLRLFGCTRHSALEREI